jgi:hypothetical protein
MSPPHPDDSEELLAIVLVTLAFAVVIALAALV